MMPERGHASGQQSMYLDVNNFSGRRTNGRSSLQAFLLQINKLFAIFKERIDLHQICSMRPQHEVKLSHVTISPAALAQRLSHFAAEPRNAGSITGFCDGG